MKARKVCIQDRCNRMTANRMGICDHCRSIIMASMDMNYL
jgi:hypothetical protein